MSTPEFDLLIFAASIFAGLIGALIGLGGGIIITPVLVLAFGIDIRYAMGAALASVIATSSGAAAAYLKDGISNLKIGTFLNIATVTGAVGGALLATALPAATLSLVFGLALLVTVILSLKAPTDQLDPKNEDPLGKRLQLGGSYPDGEKTIVYGVQKVIPGFCMMILAGVLSGLLGIGSGAFKVLAMDRIMRIPFKVSTTTSNFMIGVTAAASIGIYLKKGYLDPTLIFPVALGVLAGAFVGAKILPYAPTTILRIIFLLAVTGIGVEMILRGLGVGI